MERRIAVSYVAAFVALSLLLSPLLMADFHETATARVEPIDRSELQDGTPILEFGELPQDARNLVRRAIEAHDGTASVYGASDWRIDSSTAISMPPGRGCTGSATTANSMNWRRTRRVPFQS